MTCLGLVEPKNISWLMQANNDLHFPKICVSGKSFV